MEIKIHPPVHPTEGEKARYGTVLYETLDGRTEGLDAAFWRGAVEETTPLRKTVIQGTDASGKVVSLADSREPAAALAARFDAVIFAHHERVNQAGLPILDAQVSAAEARLADLEAKRATPARSG